jgi:imidazolonepropionase-like amidohydrolase
MIRVALACAVLVGCVHFPSYRELVSRPAQPPQRVLIRDVRVFAATGPKADEHRDVWIASGKIEDLRPTGAPGPAADLEIDGRGLTLLPGFIDLHVHLTYTGAPPWYPVLPKPEHNAQAHVYAGVTTVLDMGGDPSEILALKKKIAAGELAGPRIFFSGWHLTVPGGYPLDMIRDVYGRLAYFALEGSHARGATSVADLVEQIDRVHQLGGTFIKLMVATVPPSGAPRLSEEMVLAAVKRAHGHGMKVAAHIDTADDALICARTGVDLLAHGIEAPAVTEAQAQQIAASGIHLEPTLVNFERFDELADGHYAGSQLERESEPPELLAQFSDEKIRAQRDSFEKSSFHSWGEELEKYRAERPRNLMKLFAAGVPVHAGDDAQGSIAAFAGGYHDELRMEIEAGMPAAEVLLGATARAARFLDDRADFGTVETGKTADLVLVRGDPLADISTTRNIVQVFIAGVPLERHPPQPQR